MEAVPPSDTGLARDSRETDEAGHPVLAAELSHGDWKAIFALLDVALELEPARLPEWFATLDPSQTAHADAVRTLLAQRSAPETGDFLRTPLPPGAAAARPEPVAGPGLVGPYRLLHEIGRGGTATVWLAERADGLLERRVALKLPHLSWGGSAFAERMARERNILASLTHPNIARLYDAGIDADGRPFLALEYVDGQPIDAFAEARQLTVHARIGLLVQVARAVAHAHAQLVVHRDLKPSNILVDADGRCHLVDFGIAKLIDPPIDGNGEGDQLTVVTGRALTPDYASPEQIRGDPIGTGSDVYSLGVVAFELLAGVRPYRLNVGLGAVALASAIAAVDVPRASRVAVDDDRRRALTGDLDAILARMLAKASDERYAGIDAVADELERHLRGEPVQARPPSRWYVTERWVRRHKLETGIGAALSLALVGGAYAEVLVLLALGIGVLAALWQRNRALRQAALAKVALERGEQVKSFIASIFTQAVPRAGRGGAVAAVDLLKAAAKRIETDLAGQPAVAAELGALIGTSFNALGDVRAGFEWLPKAVEMCTREFGPTHRLTLQSRRRLGEAANTVGELVVSERVLPSLVADLRAVVPPEPELLVGALESHAFVHTKRGREAEAMAALHESVAIASEHFGDASETTLGARSALSNTYVHFARYVDALDAIAPAMAAAVAAYGDQRPHLMLTTIERAHADALALNNRPREATPLLRQVLVDQTSLDAVETQRVRVAMSLLAKCLLLRGHVDEASTLFADALAMQVRLGLRSTDEAAGSLGSLAFACVMQGRAELALQHIAEALDVMAGRNEAVVQTHVRLCTLALAEIAVGRPTDALVTVAPVLGAPAPLGTIALRATRVYVTAWRLASDPAEALEKAETALASLAPACAALEQGLMHVEAARCCMALADGDSAASHWRRARDAWGEGQVDGVELIAPLRAEFSGLATAA